MLVFAVCLNRQLLFPISTKPKFVRLCVKAISGPYPIQAEVEEAKQSSLSFVFCQLLELLMKMCDLIHPVVSVLLQGLQPWSQASKNLRHSG